MNTLTLPGYKITTSISDGFNTSVYRGIRQSDEQPVIIKILKAEFPTLEQITRLKNEYKITQHLHADSIVTYYSLETYQNRLALISEDFGGNSLGQIISKKLDLTAFLNIGIQLASALNSLHQNGIIHKDIKPSNIIINLETGIVKITDFSIASRLSKETPQINSANLVEGTVAYMSPEQTGRMNRTLDYRSDFYSLGVTFYEMLTGKLPFKSNDILELVHCHIAKHPAPPSECRRNLENSDLVPQVVSDIVMKLLGKNAEDRYQTAEGIKADLENCLNSWQTTGEVAYFVPGQLDRSGQLSIPQKLYGRELEVDSLLAAFERVGTRQCRVPTGDRDLLPGRSEIVLVSGYSGIGKTAIVNEVHKPIVRQRGYFINGKFDQFKRNIPYAALIQAFGSLIGQLLTESSENLQAWREKLAAALGTNGAVIVDVIPEIELIIGKQPEVPQLGAAESQNRFNRVFQEFIGVFTRAEHPLVIFLDDLQWADSASLNLMQLLLGNSESKYLLLIGAYRDNEVHPTHPLVQAIEQIAKTGTPVNNIVLQPLDFGNVCELIADTITANDKVRLLAELIFHKTGGNPFFITQLLQALYQENLLHFELSSGSWQWDLAQIQAIGITDKSVVELVASRIEKLPETTQRVLKLAACIGDTFTLDVLSIVNEQSQAQAASELWAALQTGLVLPLSNAYKIPLVGGWGLDNLRSIIPASQSKIAYKFLHDRVQQAAYSLIPDAQKQATHLKIGQLLLKNTPVAEIDDNVFDIVNQLNVGVEFLTEKTEKDELAKLNLIAGKKAKASNAYEAAVRYLNVGLELINSSQSPVSMQSSWDTDYDLTLNLHVEAAEAEYLNTNFGRSQELADLVLQQAVSVLDKIKVYEIQIQSYMSQNQFSQAVDYGLKAVEILGLSLSEIPPENLAGIKLPQIEELEKVPVMTDDYQLAAMRILSVLLSPAFGAKPELLPQIIFTMVDFGMESGYSALGAIAYTWYGLLLSAVLGELNAGYHSGQLGLKLLDKFNAKQLKSKIYNMFNTFVRHWKEHARETIVSLMEGIQSGLETGDLEFGSYCAMNYCNHLFLIGEPLENVAQKQGQYINLTLNLKQDFPSVFIRTWSQMVLNLMGRSTNKSQLIGDEFNEIEMLPNLKVNWSFFNFYFAKTLLHYLFKEYDMAVANASLAVEYAGGMVGYMMVGTNNFYYSLALLAVYPTADSAAQEKYLMQVAANQEQMQTWAHHAPMNYQHKYDLVEAEKARVFGKNWEAADYYDKAIQGAKEQGYIQEEALANELAAEFYFSRNKDKIAQVYLTESYYGYIHWGAIAKVKDLEARYPQLVAQTLNRETKTRDLTVTATTTTTSSDFSKSLDIGTFVKASQAITSEIVLDKLLASLIEILLENAAAQKAVLMLYKDDSLLIQAACTSEQNQAVVLQSLPVEISQDLPVSIVNYVARTQKDLVLNNAASDGLFTEDPYIVSSQPKSILCNPVIYQGQLTGILYLENNLAVGAFSPERLQVLKVLTSQVAIALENAKLYAKAQQKSQQLEQSLHKLQQTQAQLVQTEKISSLGQLVAGVAHEVNNPVGFISGNLHHANDYVRDLICIVNLYQQHYPQPVQEIAEAAEDMELDYLMEDLPKMLGSMQLGTDRIRDIMQSLRNFSRVDGNEKKPADIHAGIESTLMILQHRLKANAERPSIQVIKEYGDLPAVECYSGQLNQVFMNLLSNAIDALDESNASRTYADIDKHPNIITVCTEVKDVKEEGIRKKEEGRRKKEEGRGNKEEGRENKEEVRGGKSESFAVIRIKDNGRGMAEATRCKLFDPFFTTKPEGKGTGLGLSISYQIVVEKHGGAIECISEPGKGAEFVIAIPLN
ncbi:MULTISPECIES: ATP-binding sensor histidine kinase [unclassified Microcoleus]|uniref:trifunctional serine/threonine-protein kinase/ATP-binding protein/sensor histidine kinase n=1 Tax=unclassified Microcoleus TaxID=2642155 RepID=UPI001E0E1F60|nr:MULTISPECIES: ATP-binding sensor histidine kinase [unclassified Microcoleus]MCC3506087.1 AAA family ATPase [Microcoleus sp. PH2017_19_SFW_U_A]TAG91222.1 MAG: GAF domain-containing protein [Oscillatoriales cyanobacterium]MCC3475930.1 AAA family ATPase [Microcoleus sp. PH2017_13_LAR_U_A]MCC3488457.1 AAA family ATPase [Microcoleus sp. PH2017_14_LAR_D_A]MCC3525807.1 AAA family ATPase [Microcoleus sp. PH2017_20_SFW_D_A]